jgi:hypothetical protein
MTVWGKHRGQAHGLTLRVLLLLLLLWQAHLALAVGEDA